MFSFFSGAGAFLSFIPFGKIVLFPKVSKFFGVFTKSALVFVFVAAVSDLFS